MWTPSVPISLIYGFLLSRNKCSAFTSTTIPVAVPSPRIAGATVVARRPIHSSSSSSRDRSFSSPPALPTRKNAAAAAATSATALHAKGFGPPPPTPNPSAYYAPDDDEDEGEARGPPPGGGEEQPFPDVFADTSRKVETPKGIGTLLSSGDEVIRELSSEEYLDILRDWAPLASFASNEALDPEIMESAGKIRTVLRGMAVSCCSTTRLVHDKNTVRVCVHDAVLLILYCCLFMLQAVRGAGLGFWRHLQTRGEHREWSLQYVHYCTVRLHQLFLSSWMSRLRFVFCVFPTSYTAAA